MGSAGRVDDLFVEDPKRRVQIDVGHLGWIKTSIDGASVAAPMASLISAGTRVTNKPEMT